MKALAGKAIVKFLPYRRDGIVEIPDSVEPPSIEAEMISDGGGKEMPEIQPGQIVFVSRMVGEYFNHDGVQYCRVPRGAVMMQREEAA